MCTQSLDFDAPPSDPLVVLHQWLDEARERTDLPNPNAMYVATVDDDGQPSVRTVLLRDLDAEGAVFYTNRRSRKGQALAAHPRAALLFHWDVLDRQIRIEGSVSETSDDQSDAYFAQRHRLSQIGAWASEQSKPLPNRTALLKAVLDYEAKFEDQPVPRPPHWGGYRVALESIEFWQGHEYRIHDRIVYRRDVDGWTVERLAP